MKVDYTSRILIVEDEPEMCELLSQVLTECGYGCDVAHNGLEGLSKSGQCDLMLVDVMMPVLSGFALVEQMRSQGNRTPVIYLTAKDSTKDIVRGLQVGGDDYLVKPFKLDELLARIQAVLRRAKDSATVLVWHEFSMDTVKRTVFRAGHEVYLSPTEFSLFEMFMRHPEIVLSKSQLLGEVWADDGYRAENIVELYINYVRRKTELRNSSRVIQTVRGRGYVLAKADLEP